MQTAWIVVITLLAGGVIGSLINLVATRLPADLAIAGWPLRSPDSRPSRWTLVPFVGAANRDGAGIDWPKLATELAAVAVVVTAIAARGSDFDGYRALVYASVLLLILRIDWQNHLIYMITIVPGLVLALIFSALDSPAQLVSSAIAGVGAAFIFLMLFMLAFAIYKQRALGFGDVLLAALIGTMTGIQGVGSALLLGIILAAAGGLLLIAIRVRKRTDFIPYGAYLSLGAMIVVLIGQY